MLNEYGDIIMVKDLCSILHIGKNTAYKMLRNKAIPSLTIANKHLIPKTAVIQFIKNNLNTVE